MLEKGIEDALSLLKKHQAQQHLAVTNDELVIAYLKGYGDKENSCVASKYGRNIEKYAYLMGFEGDYIGEGLTEDDISEIVRNAEPTSEVRVLETGK